VRWSKSPIEATPATSAAGVNPLVREVSTVSLPIAGSGVVAAAHLLSLVDDSCTIRLDPHLLALLCLDNRTSR
jgi:hypothetical protein